MNIALKKLQMVNAVGRIRELTSQVSESVVDWLEAPEVNLQCGVSRFCLRHIL